MNTMRVEDFVVLGRTVPEESKTFGKRVCMAGYSPANNQFLRVYPLLVPVGENAGTNGFKARHSYSLDLRRNPQDSRSESWRLVDEKKPTSTTWAAASATPKKAIVDWLSKRVVTSINSLNECHLSIGVVLVRAGEWEGIVVPRSQLDVAEEHRGLFEDLADQSDIDASQIQYAPYIRFRDSGGDHRLQVREWGAYRLLENPAYSNRPDALWGAAGYRTGHDLVLVIGNMGNHRRNWLTIKTFEADQQDDGGLFKDVEPE